MNRKAFRKIFLPGVMLLFSVLVLGQSGWACDTPDYNEYECYGELDIKRVTLDYDNGLIQIFGKDFKNGAFPVVTLGDDGLDVLDHDYNKIVVRFPAVEAGQYKLGVSTGKSRNCKDKYSLNIPHDNKPSCPPPSQTCPEGCKGAKGDPGEPGKPGKDGEPGQPGPGVESAEAITLPPGSQATALLDTKTRVLTIGVPQGDPGVKSAVAVTVDSSKSATASLDTKTSVLTIEVPRGAAGTNGKDGAVGGTIRSVTYEHPISYEVLDGDTSIFDPDFRIAGTANCPTGFTVTGGGFSSSKNLKVIMSMPSEKVPLETGNGWYVNGIVRDEVFVGDMLEITIYAVCAQLQ
jgi:hypothetical protein